MSGLSHTAFLGDAEYSFRLTPALIVELEIVDRVGIALRVDDVTGLDNGIVKVRWRRRVGGAPLLNEAAILVKSIKA